MHPFYNLARALDAGEITVEEYREQAEDFRQNNPVELGRIGGGLGKETGVPTALLAPIVEKRMRRLDAEIGWNDIDNNGETTGAVNAIAGRLSLIRGIAEHAAMKLIWRIRTEESECTHIGAADALMLALDLSPIAEDLPYLPGTPAGAIEQIEAYIDVTGAKMTDDEKWELIHTLDRFALGFMNGGVLCGDEKAHAATLWREEDMASRIARKLAKEDREELAESA